MLVTTKEHLDEVVRYLEHDARFFAFDVETTPDGTGADSTRLDPWRNNVVWISLGDDVRQFSIPMGFPNGEFVREEYPLKETADLRARLARGLKPRRSDYSVDRKKATKIFTDPPEHLTRTEVFAALKPFFHSDRLLKVGHNLSFDLGSVTKYLGGQIPQGPYADTRIAAYLVDATQTFGFGLKDVAKKYADIDMVKGVGKYVEEHSLQEVHEYALLDAKATALVWAALEPMIERDNLANVFALEMDVLPIIVQMRLRGVPIDQDALSDLKDSLEEDIERVKTQIFDTVGRTFSLTSNSEKQKLLYLPKSQGGRGLKPSVLTPGGREKERAGMELSLSDYSVGADALESYRGQDFLVDQLLEHTALAKLLSTYVIPYAEGRKKVSALVDKDGKIHTDFNQIGAATGRFSSSNPNLQNVPNSATEYGKLIRNLFIAPDDHMLVVADYSQIEPRLIAGFSRDPVMMRNYHEGGDLYTTIGEKLGLDRKAGKVLVLSIAYGVGPDKISKQIGCDVDEAKELLSDFNDKFPRINLLKKRVVNKALGRTVPYVSTPAGRRRYLPELKSDTFWMRLRAERQAFNTLIQGTAADTMKMALIEVAQQIPDSAYITLTVHDEVVVVTPQELTDETAHAVRTAMESVALPGLGVPLLAEVMTAKRWGEAK